jgi:hypothetical protein
MNEWINDLSEIDREKVKLKFKEAKDDKATYDIYHDWHPKGHLNPTPITSLDEYFKYIRFCATDSTWFRGESREHEYLIPKLYRNLEEINLDAQLQKEKKFVLEFRRRGRNLGSNINQNNEWEWYFLAQHYGGPTRLLDWTSDAGVALFMALDTNRDKTDNPVIYTLQPTVLSGYAYKEFGQEYRSGVIQYPGDEHTEKWISNIFSGKEIIPQSPIALLPVHHDARIISQSSCFTLFGKRINGFFKDGKEIVCDCCGQRIRHKIIIDGTKKQSLRKQLSLIGVTSGKIYQGLDGLCKEIYQEIYEKK